MKQKDVILYASLAGGAYLAYWYITNYGPNGVAGGINPSYWDVWFGAHGATTHIPSPPTGNAELPANQQGNNPGNTTIVQPAIVATVSLRDKLMQASGNVAQMNAHQWNYYRNQIAPPAWSGEQMASAFPGESAAALMTVDQFLSAAHSVGLAGIGMGAIVPVQSMSQIPSMTFGGSFKSNFPMQGNMKGPVN